MKSSSRNIQVRESFSSEVSREKRGSGNIGENAYLNTINSIFLNLDLENFALFRCNVLWLIKVADRYLSWLTLQRKINTCVPLLHKPHRFIGKVHYHWTCLRNFQISRNKFFPFWKFHKNIILTINVDLLNINSLNF